jgi:hypothetical protein
LVRGPDVVTKGQLNDEKRKTGSKLVALDLLRLALRWRDDMTGLVRIGYASPVKSDEY